MPLVDDAAQSRGAHGAVDLEEDPQHQKHGRQHDERGEVGGCDEVEQSV